MMYIAKDYGGNSLDIIWLLSWHFPGEMSKTMRTPDRIAYVLAEVRTSRI
jgi:hypothetical protein